MIVEKEMFLGVDGKQVGMEMTECQLAVSVIKERSVDWQLWAGTAAQITTSFHTVHRHNQIPLLQ